VGSAERPLNLANRAAARIWGVLPVVSSGAAKGPVASQSVASSATELSMIFRTTRFMSRSWAIRPGR